MHASVRHHHRPPRHRRRRAGKSRREIKELLGVGSNQTLNNALRGEPPQPWTWRPNAKDEVRVKARELRQKGLGYDDIVAELGVSKSTVSAWVSDMPRLRSSGPRP
jgi:transcriptional regulator with XRE-family HTH domain